MKRNRVIFTIVSIALGFLVGGLILAAVGFNLFDVYSTMFKGVFSRPKYIAWTIIRSVPIILTGLSVAFAFRTGLFNIGAEGQFIIGALVAALLGYFLELPLVIHAIVVLIGAGIAAGLWGSIAGYLRAKFGVHEVISTIMLNWIALYLNNYVVSWEKFRRPQSEASYKILDSASIGILQQWKRTDAGREFLSNSKFLREILSAPVNWGIIIAILCAIMVWYILQKTTLGYELRAVGLNQDASEYGGINVRRSILTSMFISGILAGLAGAIHVLGVTKEVAILSFMEGSGFDGIAVALLGNNTPLGSVLSGLLFGALKYSGPKIQSTMGAPSEVINIMIGSIVFFTSMPSFIKIIASKFKRRRGEVKVD
ncbi:ABC-type uncharacterized transport system, permease component [Gottschalkia purinilytica]|uniref:ABC-type uncharacterized transport system, permease component n=1 Tax=Gottschalkia purinilytica TaxID=1503 RepID=A0A0L0WF78_GOTPU|nr:ABC transporter permease [Gottschalkia purinilytica]KNF10124.1 ABC-type uncharacterized transport system, permease component [Gottschalkia purinilytica]